MSARTRITVFCLVSLFFIGCDRATKDLARIHLKDKAPLSWFHNTVRLEYVENTGAFLSFGAEWPRVVSFWVLSVIPLLFLLAFFAFAVKKSGQTRFLDMLPYAMIFSGGIGNILDRILFDRHVTDFMNLGVPGLRTGIFNFADVYVSAGVLLLIILHFRRGIKQDPRGKDESIG
jgi:signal peptidase II